MPHVNRLGLLFSVLCVLAFPTATFASTISYSQCDTCGPTGGQALQILFQGVTAPSVTAIGLVNTSASYNPGTITNIFVSVDKDSSFSQATPLTITFASGFRPLIEQDGIIYLANPSITGPVFGSNTTPSAFFTSGWATIQCNPANSTGCPNSQTSLTLGNFVQFSFATGTFGSATPNLTDPVYFGFGVINSIANPQVSNGTIEGDFANLSISDAPLLIDTTFSDLRNYQAFEFTSVPEPSTILLLGFGLAGLSLTGKKK